MGGVTLSVSVSLSSSFLFCMPFVNASFFFLNLAGWFSGKNLMPVWSLRRRTHLLLEESGVFPPDFAGVRSRGLQTHGRCWWYLLRIPIPWFLGSCSVIGVESCLHTSRLFFFFIPDFSSGKSFWYLIKLGAINYWSSFPFHRWGGSLPSVHLPLCTPASVYCTSQNLG